jgi:hypothetical protein
VLLEELIVEDIERVHFGMLDVVSHLPTDAACGMQHSDQCIYQRLLAVEVILDAGASLVLFSDVIWRRSDDQLDRVIRDGADKISGVSIMYDDVFVLGERISNLMSLKQGKNVCSHRIAV